MTRFLSDPPEGVLAGEDVPVENQAEEFTEAEIQRVEAALKKRGEPYLSMSDSELREKARERIE